jgi:hypothetical protein
MDIFDQEYVSPQWFTKFSLQKPIEKMKVGPREFGKFGLEAFLEPKALFSM